MIMYKGYFYQLIMKEHSEAFEFRHFFEIFSIL